MRLIDEQYLRTPFFGSRQMSAWLRRELDEVVNRKRVQRLMRTMGIEAVAPGPRTTVRNSEHRVFPYLLRNVSITRKDQVWSTDITYIPLRVGFMDVVAVMDWHTRYVLSWRLSNTLEGHFCIEALEESLLHGRPSHAGREGTAAVMDGPGSIVLDIADNRLHVQKAVMALLMTKTPIQKEGVTA